MGFVGVVILLVAWTVVVWVLEGHRPRESRDNLHELLVRGEISPHDFEEVRLHHVS